MMCTWAGCSGTFWSDTGEGERVWRGRLVIIDAFGGLFVPMSVTRGQFSSSFLALLLYFNFIHLHSTS